MISAEQLNPEGLTLDAEQVENFQHLLVVCNRLEQAYGKPLVVNRGVSSVADQLRIDPAHPDDAHVKAAGVDFKDREHELQAWCLKNEPLLAALDLWFEDFLYTPLHVHAQIYPPKSGRRFFIP